MLTRHPLAVFSSYANSFFNGSWTEAHRYNPVVERYLPAIAQLLRDKPVSFAHVVYEELVSSPEKELEKLFTYLELENDAAAVNYGSAKQKAGMGDPITVASRSRPTTESLYKWVAELNGDAQKLELAKQMIGRIPSEDLKAWGYDDESLWQPLSQMPGALPSTPFFNKYTLQRRVLLALRKNVNQRPHGKIIRKVRYYCDAILRDAL